MSGYNKSMRWPSSLLAFALASSLILVLCLQAATVKGSTQSVNNNGDIQDNNDDEEFYDAEPDAFEIMDIDGENGEETWYDAEDEIGYDESAEEDVCASSDVHSCPTCCRHLGFDLPHWNVAIGQCLCYLSEADQNVCKAPVASEPSAQTCQLCCTNNHYEQSFFSKSSHACYCSLPDQRYYPWASNGRVRG